jgi:hypothetical protein
MGRMTDEMDHLEEHCRAVALLPAEERIAWIRRERWIEPKNSSCLTEVRGVRGIFGAGAG